MTTTETFPALLDYAYFKDAVVRDATPPADDDGFFYSRLIPGDRVEDDFCECRDLHVEGGGEGWNVWTATVCDDCGAASYWPTYG